jgi:bifunctional DNA-binding transcriptional regulator/antitoxin component of YhaV-PrlF toxin-antitoxin module
MADKDYSHRDVLDKLGLKPGQFVRVAGRGDKALLARVREKIGRRLSGAGTPADVILYWPGAAEEITGRLKELRAGITPAGGIWVMTAKRGQTSASGMGYLNQFDLIPLGLAAGLVDNKTCSVSERESGMRFVIPVTDRR